MSISHQDGVRTYIAYDHQLARPVLAHLVDTAGPYTLHDIEALLALLPAKDAAQIVENAMTERGMAVISLPSEGLNHFIAWLTDRIGVPRASSDASAQPAPPAVPLPPVAPTPAAIAPPVMPMPLTPPPGAVSAPPVMPPVMPTVMPPAAPVAAEPRLTSSAAPAGEFTQMFRPKDVPMAAAPQAAPPMPVAAFPPAPVAPPPAPIALPPAAVAIPPAPIAKAPPAPAAGEFTQMFSPGAHKPTAGPPPSATPPAPLPPAPPLPTPPASMPNAGFDARGLSSLPPLPPTAPPAFNAPPPSAWPPPVPAPALHPPALQSPAPHSLPDVALTPPTPMAAVPSVLPPPMFGLPEPGAAAKKERAIGPSEATLIMKKQVPLVTASTAEREADKPTQKTPTRLTLPIILTINAVVLLTLALILYFVFRTPPDTVPTLTGAKAAADSTRRAAVDSGTPRDSAARKK